MSSSRKVTIGTDPHEVDLTKQMKIVRAYSGVPMIFMCGPCAKEYRGHSTVYKIVPDEGGFLLPGSLINEDANSLINNMDSGLVHVVDSGAIFACRVSGHFGKVIFSSNDLLGLRTLKDKRILLNRSSKWRSRNIGSRVVLRRKFGFRDELVETGQRFGDVTNESSQGLEIERISFLKPSRYLEVRRVTSTSGTKSTYRKGAESRPQGRSKAPLDLNQGKSRARSKTKPSRRRDGARHPESRDDLGQEIVMSVRGKLLRKTDSTFFVDWLGGGQLVIHQSTAHGDWSGLEVGQWLRATISQKLNGEVVQALLLGPTEEPKVYTEDELIESYSSIPAANLKPVD